MSTINKHLFTKFENGEKVIFCKIEKSKVEIPARLVPQYYTKELCKAKKWTYTDSVGDGGVDAVTPKGTKHIQCKVLAENPSSYTITTKKYNTKEEARGFTDEEMLEALKEYAKNFDTLMIYTTKYRGDAFDKKNAEILSGEDIVKWFYEHASQSYMNVGKQYYRQVRFYKTQKRVWA